MIGIHRHTRTCTHMRAYSLSLPVSEMSLFFQYKSEIINAISDDHKNFQNWKQDFFLSPSLYFLWVRLNGWLSSSTNYSAWCRFLLDVWCRWCWCCCWFCNHFFLLVFFSMLFSQHKKFVCFSSSSSLPSLHAQHTESYSTDRSFVW